MASARVRTLLLPPEHGAWSFILEPLVLGLLVAFSAAAPWLALATLAVFFARQPARLVLQDLARRQRYPRTLLAARLAIGLTTAAGLFGLLAWRVSPHPWWLPVLFAAPLALLQLAYDVHREGRGLVPELAGPVAAAASAPALAAAAGWEPAMWVTLWTLVAAKALTATVYVRARLRLEKGAPSDSFSSLLAHLAALAVATELAREGFAPWLGVVAFALLTVRAVIGLSPGHRSAPARTIGFTEVAWGIAFVVIVAIGYWQGW